MIVWFLLLIAIVAGVAGQITLKKGAADATLAQGSFAPDISHAIGLFLSPLVLLGIFFYGLSAVMYIIVLTKLDISLAYPLVSLGYLLVAGSAWVFLGETISLVRWAGIVLIVVGSVLVGTTA